MRSQMLINHTIVIESNINNPVIKYQQPNEQRRNCEILRYAYDHIGVYRDETANDSTYRLVRCCDVIKVEYGHKTLGRDR